MIKNRNIVAVYLLTIFTLGIYRRDKKPWRRYTYCVAFNSAYR